MIKKTVVVIGTNGSYGFKYGLGFQAFWYVCVEIEFKSRKI